ncbi:FAD-NAD(P)-binding-domain-containing protein [Penicillium macrosclerotiorum]|uniref:FAD-NAD(P)-binding-domain-containing protein n=1 Tax=Penicillium macrosclerotiorum TaxID=303699 RepID=UPI002547802B|nr:FAD-NAD(P)-binding-domain-containing protein [Penicillium macrosclerotiorum]KAJ5678757.1 FAD-NAD(P)-binding-domain-containing protein [Penicillium macrosclerotiorum]
MVQILPQTIASSSSSTPDIVVVGGGASGLAVLLQLIERAKNGKQLGKIAVLEKNKTPGPGLAYSNACVGTILNMHTDTMGLYFDQPQHFTKWRKNLDEGDFPSREHYGEYLQYTWSEATQEAKQAGLDLSVIHQEAHHIDQSSDGTFVLTLDNDTRILSQAVVLALGNFTAVCNPQLINLPGFLPSPWPLPQLKSIPPDATIIVVGSRLSAVDTVTYLVDNGHRGTITLMSRSGRLPKVQGDQAPYSRRYVLHELARQIEANPEEGLLQVMSGVVEELSEATNGDWSWIVDDESPVKQLQQDIQAAQAGRVEWQAVLRATAPVIERYWNCMSPRSQQLFMTKYHSTWMRFRHAMPVQNAQKIMKLLESSQLRVVQGSLIEWDGIFKAQTSSGIVEASYVIEATGQECHLDRIHSPLIQSTLKNNLATAHPNGGLAVDFDSLAASPGLYAIGSLTRGTHFYVSAIDRIAAHASRIAYALTKEPYARPLHVAIFCGSDLFSHLMISKLVPQLLAAGHMPFIYLPKHRASRSATPFDLRELAFFERELLQHHILPYFKDKPFRGATHKTVYQLRDTYGILVEEVPDVNKMSFIKTLAKHHINVGLSLRCYQRFKTDIIRYFSQPRRLLNLHPGTLPAYRGVMTTVRAMKNKETHFGYSLHDIDENWDSGDVIDIREHPIDYSKSMLAFMEDVYSMGVGVAVDAIDKIARGKQLPKTPQNAEASGYYTFPTKEELHDINQSGIRLVDAESIVSIIVKSFAPEKDQNEFRAYIETVVNDWYRQNSV